MKTFIFHFETKKNYIPNCPLFHNPSFHISISSQNNIWTASISSHQPLFEYLIQTKHWNMGPSTVSHLQLKHSKRIKGIMRKAPTLWRAPCWQSNWDVCFRKPIECVGKGSVITGFCIEYCNWEEIYRDETDWLGFMGLEDLKLVYHLCVSKLLDQFRIDFIFLRIVCFILNFFLATNLYRMLLVLF